MKLFYRKYGNGPPLFILHGLYGSSDNWVTIAKKVSEYFSVYLPDLRNHGQSPHSEVHDYDSMSEDIFELVKDLDIRKFFLAGHSMGGKAAVRFAVRWPEMLEGLLVADISPFETKVSHINSYNEHLAILKTVTETDITGAVSRKEIENIFSGKIPSARTRALIMKNIIRNSEGSYTWRINNSSLLKNIDRIIESVAGEIGTNEKVTGFPVIFLKGENSEYLPSSDFSKITRLFPSVEFRIIKNAGHWLHADNPEEVARALISLLS